jgi:hypothetical protein
MKRRVPLKRKGKERGQPLPAYRAWIRGWPCVACPSRETQAAHLPRVKQHGDAQNLVPLCGTHHMEQHNMGVQSFAERYGLDLESLANWYWEQYENS